MKKFKLDKVLKNKNQIIGKVFYQKGIIHIPRLQYNRDEDSDDRLSVNEKFIILEIDKKLEDNYWIWLKVLYKETKIGWISLCLEDYLYEIC